jgi:hypothetical protein
VWIGPQPRRVEDAKGTWLLGIEVELEHRG